MRSPKTEIYENQRNRFEMNHMMKSNAVEQIKPNILRDHKVEFLQRAEKEPRGFLRKERRLKAKR
jgi:hypothetical protein